MLPGRTTGSHFFILAQLIATAPKVGSVRSAAKRWIRQDSSLAAQGYLETPLPCLALLGGLESGTCSQNCKESVGLHDTVFQNLGFLTYLLLKSKSSIILFLSLGLLWCYHRGFLGLG